jgi:hypothetical protein
VLVGGREKVYFGADGELSLPVTGENGDWIEYWANSSFGDQSERIRLKYRNFQKDPQVKNYRFDLLAKDSVSVAPSASLIWNIFPPVNTSLPKGLQQPESVADLRTSARLVYLTGHLIQTGSASANDCADAGLLSNGMASPCGMNAAYQTQIEWQNRYDEKILAAALKYNIPARVIKGIIAQETQFWPVSESPYEMGLSKITDNGADLLLMWNLDHFLATCIPVYSEITCSAGYSNLAPDQQAILRSAIFKKAGSEDQIDILAAVLAASASQANQMLLNTIQKEPDNAISYEDMWRITIGNYNVGSGCISVGMKKYERIGAPIVWDKFVGQMAGNCQNAEIYVDKVLQFSDQ